jgi:hypothetical protein
MAASDAFIGQTISHYLILEGLGGGVWELSIKPRTTGFTASSRSSLITKQNLCPDRSLYSDARVRLMRVPTD